MKTIFVLLCLMLSVSCSDEENVTSGGGTNNGSVYRIETEPSLSYDRNTLLMVRADTQLTDLNGIYSAQVSNPIRKVELIGDDVSSPTSTAHDGLIAYLQDSSIYLYFKSIDSVYLYSEEFNFQNLFFINDSQIIASHANDILITSVFVNNFATIATGFLPTVYLSDTVAYLQSISSNSHIINLTPFAYPDGAIQIDTIIGNRPVSFGIEPIFRRYCYSIWNGQNYSIYAGGVGVDSVWQVAESRFPNVVMLDFNIIIYSGADGRLYQVDFAGTNRFPFWAALDPDIE